MPLKASKQLVVSLQKQTVVACLLDLTMHLRGSIVKGTPDFSKCSSERIALISRLQTYLSVEQTRVDLALQGTFTGHLPQPTDDCPPTTPRVVILNPNQVLHFGRRNVGEYNIFQRQNTVRAGLCLKFEFAVQAEVEWKVHGSYQLRGCEEANHSWLALNGCGDSEESLSVHAVC